MMPILEAINKDSYFLFSGSEVHSKVKSNSDEIIVTDYSMNGFMALAQQVEIYRRLGKDKIRVVYPYFPYARQDRVMERDESFSLLVFAKLLNSLNIDSVEIYDPHSDVAPALINNCHIVPQWEIAKKALPSEYFTNPEVMFISPDAGAYKKLSKLIPDDQRIAIGVKNRDAHGKITHTAVFSPQPLLGKTCVIVDDICDGGRTFVALADALKTQGAETIILYVTHGIFSQGLPPLLDHIDEIYTTNSFPQQQHQALQVYKIV